MINHWAKIIEELQRDRNAMFERTARLEEQMSKSQAKIDEFKMEVNAEDISKVESWMPRQPETEAEKAIRDGKPRWIKHEELGWQYVNIFERQDWRPKPLLLYREAVESDSGMEAPLMLVIENVEILPHGETPPPAKPEPVAHVRFVYNSNGVTANAMELDVHDISIGCVPIECWPDERGHRRYKAGNTYIFTFAGDFYGKPQLACYTEGELTVQMTTEGGHRYSGQAKVLSCIGRGSTEGSHPVSYKFEMKRESEEQVLAEDEPIAHNFYSLRKNGPYFGLFYKHNKGEDEELIATFMREVDGECFVKLLAAAADICDYAIPSDAPALSESVRLLASVLRPMGALHSQKE